MKRDYYCKINALSYITVIMLFCCGSILLAQIRQPKLIPKRTTTLNENKQKAENNSNIVANTRLQRDLEVAVLETDYGKIVIELYPKIAPLMVERFKKLIKESFYDGTTFHRVSPSLGIIQGGDPNSKDTNPLNDGYGNSPYPNLPAEFSDVPYERGIVGAARTNDPNSANCQFFIMLKRQSIFDKNYTVFGRVIGGLTNAYIINISPTERGTERPEDPVVVRHASLQLRKRFTASN